MKQKIGSFSLPLSVHMYMVCQLHLSCGGIHKWQRQSAVTQMTHVTCSELLMVLWRVFVKIAPVMLKNSQIHFYRAMLCIRGTSHGPLSVRPSVCPSVTSWRSNKTAKRMITQTTPHNSPGTLVFWNQRSPRNSTEVTPYGGAKCRWGGSKSATFDTWFLLKSNRKSYALYRMVTLPMTLSDP